MATDKTKVVVLGGGCGGMATAFWLTSTAALRERFEVTVVTRGWRLGGKGASGRNAAHSQRIEEHGLHMWMGCYENAFRTMRACYDELPVRPERRFKRWSDAFSPQFRITVTERLQDAPAGWRLWDFVLPRRRGTPGDGAPLAGVDPLLALANWLARHRPCRGADGGPRPAAASSLGESATAWPSSAVALLTLAVIRVATWLLQAIQAGVAGIAAATSALAPRRPTPHWIVMVDLVLAVAVGVARDIVPFGDRGFDRINEFDFRAWLSRHGALRATVESAPVRALYDLGFAYPGGDASDFANGRGAAGAALRFLLELGLGYKGAPLWKMNAGMGDAVFAPLYEVLVGRGVRFRFFRHVAHLELSADRVSVASVVLQRQADLKTPTYDPLVQVGGIDCWPSEPLWTQLVGPEQDSADGARFESIWDSPSVGEETLLAGHDFDLAVVAFAPEMIRCVAPQLAEHSAAWKGMLENSTSVATQACQYWLRPSLSELGWPGSPPVLSAYASPFDTWADMSHLLAHEGWKGHDAPKTIAYFCGVLPLPQTLPRNPIEVITAQVRLNADAWLAEHARLLWPALPDHGAKDEGGPVVASYFRCNIDPSERYVQTLPGSVRHRLAPGSRTFANLYLAGDWTTTRYSSGCVEAAIESGMLAARAIGANPVPIYGGAEVGGR